MDIIIPISLHVQNNTTGCRCRAQNVSVSWSARDFKIVPLAFFLNTRIRRRRRWSPHTAQCTNARELCGVGGVDVAVGGVDVAVGGVDVAVDGVDVVV